ANVTVLMDVGLERFNRLMADSRFCVLPLAHARMPCGHSTMVAFMHLGKAQVVTNSSGVRDYVRENDNGLLVPPGDANAMAERIEALWNDETSCARMGAAARRFAREKCSERSSVRHFERYLRHYGVLSQDAMSGSEVRAALSCE
ncbi:MAG: glycosyltransferase, partial [Proteobacteria bacterium]|nr:glycosyltransferase [Pseudomonadota bacterium]